MAILLNIVAILYFLFALSPFWIPAIVSKVKDLPRPWLFSLIVSCLAYGLLTLLFFGIVIPAETYYIFVAPELENAGKPYGKWFVIAGDFISEYIWFVLPIVILMFTIIVTRKLMHSWRDICLALAR